MHCSEKSVQESEHLQYHMSDITPKRMVNCALSIHYKYRSMLVCVLLEATAITFLWGSYYCYCFCYRSKNRRRCSSCKSVEAAAAAAAAAAAKSTGQASCKQMSVELRWEEDEFGRARAVYCCRLRLAKNAEIFTWWKRRGRWREAGTSSPQVINTRSRTRAAHMRQMRSNGGSIKVSCAPTLLASVHDLDQRESHLNLSEIILPHGVRTKFNNMQRLPARMRY